MRDEVLLLLLLYVLCTMLEYTARLACGGVDRVNCVGCCPVELLLLLRDELLALLCAVQRRDPRSFFIYRQRRLKHDSDCTRTRRNPQCRARRNTVALACVAVVPRFGCTSYVTIRQVSFMRHLKKYADRINTEYAAEIWYRIALTNYSSSFQKGPETWMVPFCWQPDGRGKVTETQTIFKLLSKMPIYADKYTICALC